MRRYLLCLVAITVVTLTSCHTGRKAVSSHSRQPRFIDDIYMDAHNKNSATADAVDRNIKPAAKKYPTKRYASKNNPDVESKAADNGLPKVCISKGETKELRDKYAGMLGVSKKEISNYNLYSFIDEWYGTAYHMGGQDKSGIDCSGFAKKLYEVVFGTDLAHSSAELYSTCKHVKKGGDVEEGDLVFFKTHGRHISHVGVYLMNYYFVHASTSQGVVISSLKEEYWQKHYVGAGKAHRG
jgi:lipoprotein Spr